MTLKDYEQALVWYSSAIQNYIRIVLRICPKQDQSRTPLSKLLIFVCCHKSPYFGMLENKTFCSCCCRKHGRHYVHGKCRLLPAEKQCVCKWWCIPTPQCTLLPGTVCWKVGGQWVIYSVLPWRQGGKGLTSFLAPRKGSSLLLFLILTLFYSLPLRIFLGDSGSCWIGSSSGE